MDADKMCPTLISKNRPRRDRWLQNPVTMKYLITIALVVALASCATVDRRHYTNGFYVERNHSLSYDPPQERTITQEKPVVPSPVRNPVAMPVNDEAKPFVSRSPAPEKIGSEKTEVISHKKLSQIQTVNMDKKITPSPLSSKEKEKEAKARTQRTIGWILVGFSILSLAFLWPLIFCVVPGVILLVMSKNTRESMEEENNTSEQLSQDVVYLKNGSVIHGTIIEQVPNVSLKIQTRDGSIFFYKMDEIEKIAKEISKS